MSEDDIELIEPDEVREGDRNCPVCGARMMLERKGKVVIEICPDHGVWLDKGELDHILLQAAARSAGKRRRAIENARRDGKVSGAMWGWWSLLG